MCTQCSVSLSVFSMGSHQNIKILWQRNLASSFKKNASHNLLATKSSQVLIVEKSVSSKTVFFFSSLWLCWLEDRRCLCYNLSVGVNNRSADVRCIQTKFTRDNHLVNQFCHQRLCKKMYFELVDQPGYKSIVQLKIKFYVWCFI